MFEWDKEKQLINGVVIGIYNFDKSSIESLKLAIESHYQCNIHYIEITQEFLKQQKLQKRQKKNNSDELGIISSKFIYKIQQLLPGAVIQMIDITNLAMQMEEPEKIFDYIIKEIGVMKNNYLSSCHIIVIKNLCHGGIESLNNNNYNIGGGLGGNGNFEGGYGNNFMMLTDEMIKNNILLKAKYIEEKNIIFIRDNTQFKNEEFMSSVGNLIKDEVTNFYLYKIKYYHGKFLNSETNSQKEYAIKYLIKLYLLSFMTHNIQDINFSYIQNAYDILIHDINPKNYMFCPPDMKTIYLELKNIGDFLIQEIISAQNLSKNDIIKYVINHLLIFDYTKFFFNKEEKHFYNSKLKDIYVINLIWKYSWFNYLDNFKEMDFINNNIIKNSMINNLLRILKLLKNEPDIFEQISQKVNKDDKYKEIKSKFFEKIPKYFEIDENENLIGRLNDEENLNLFIYNIINKNKNILSTDFIKKKLDDIISRIKLNVYDFYLINKFNLINKEKIENQNKENNQNNSLVVLGKVLNDVDNGYLEKFPNVFSHLLKKINNIIVNNYEINNNQDIKEENKNIINENNEKIVNNSLNNNNNISVSKILSNLLQYASVTKNNLTKEELKKISELLSLKNPSLSSPSSSSMYIFFDHI